MDGGKGVRLQLERRALRLLQRLLMSHPLRLQLRSEPIGLAALVVALLLLQQQLLQLLPELLVLLLQLLVLLLLLQQLLLLPLLLRLRLRLRLRLWLWRRRLRRAWLRARRGLGGPHLVVAGHGVAARLQQVAIHR